MPLLLQMIQSTIGLLAPAVSSMMPSIQKPPIPTMKAVTIKGNKLVVVEDVKQPVLQETTDAIVRIVVTTICGSDLHLYHKNVPSINNGDILGHEGVGIVEAVGPSVQHIKVGMKVVISAVIAEGSCEFCQKGEFSLCDHTNNSELMKYSYGHRTAGVFGYANIAGGYPGLQCQFARIPFADMNLLPIPTDVAVPDDRLILLSDVMCTAWHGCELGNVFPGSVVAIWGAGPVGLMTARLAFHRGAKTVISIDCISERLQIAQSLGCITVNFGNVNVLNALQRIVPKGPDVAIDTVGFRYSKSWTHFFEKLFYMETDSSDVPAECIYAIKKGGSIALIGDYFGYTNHFPIGAVMIKAVSIRGGQVYVQKYWREMLQLLPTLDLDFLFTHKMSLKHAPEAYHLFDSKKALKIILKPQEF